MIKDQLAQYCDLLEERKDIIKRIASLEDKINRIEREGNVIDSVACGRQGKKPMRTVKITGFPYPEYSKTKTILSLRQSKLQDLEQHLLEEINNLDDYINSVDNSRIRRILRYRYIDEMTWIQVANHIGGKATQDSVRMEHDRFLESN